MVSCHGVAASNHPGNSVATERGPVIVIVPAASAAPKRRRPMNHRWSSAVSPVTTTSTG